MTKATVENVKAVSSRLLWALAALLSLLVVLFVVFVFSKQVAVMPIVLIFGGLGAFTSLQRRLKQLSNEDLQLIKESPSYTFLAPLAGALLAGVLYLLFISNLLAGQMFPSFSAETEEAQKASGLMKLFLVSSADPANYAKLFFWSFVAGFSERFVTDIIGRFDSLDRT